MNNDKMTSATPKPRAGEHVRWADQYDFDRSDPATRLFIAASNWVDRCEAAEAERDLLRERERELVEALATLIEGYSKWTTRQSNAGEWLEVQAKAKAILAKVQS